MVSNESKPAPLHKTPADLGRAVRSDATVEAAWKDLTALARNEWVCWVTSAKQSTTRDRRIERTLEELKEGKRRPCGPVAGPAVRIADPARGSGSSVTVRGTHPPLFGFGEAIESVYRRGWFPAVR